MARARVAGVVCISMVIMTEIGAVLFTLLIIVLAVRAWRRDRK